MNNNKKKSKQELSLTTLIGYIGRLLGEIIYLGSQLPLLGTVKNKKKNGKVDFSWWRGKRATVKTIERP